MMLSAIALLCTNTHSMEHSNPTKKELRKLMIVKNIEKMDLEDCSICLDAIKNKNAKMILCGHVFHKKCIKKWRMKGNEKLKDMRQIITAIIESPDGIASELERMNAHPSILLLAKLLHKHSWIPQTSLHLAEIFDKNPNTPCPICRERISNLKKDEQKYFDKILKAKKKSKNKKANQEIIINNKNIPTKKVEKITMPKETITPNAKTHSKSYAKAIVSGTVITAAIGVGAYYLYKKYAK